ncbi:Uncharacterised protein [Vibrio cholerae]|nr:Uncharacterised protein [Vibrio cholerae]
MTCAVIERKVGTSTSSFCSAVSVRCGSLLILTASNHCSSRRISSICGRKKKEDIQRGFLAVCPSKERPPHTRCSSPKIAYAGAGSVNVYT